MSKRANGSRFPDNRESALWPSPRREAWNEQSRAASVEGAVARNGFGVAVRTAPIRPGIAPVR